MLVKGSLVECTWCSKYYCYLLKRLSFNHTQLFSEISPTPCHIRDTYITNPSDTTCPWHCKVLGSLQSLSTGLLHVSKQVKAHTSGHSIHILPVRHTTQFLVTLVTPSSVQETKFFARLNVTPLIKNKREVLKADYRENPRNASSISNYPPRVDTTIGSGGDCLLVISYSLAQDRSYSIANALELLQSCTKLSICGGWSCQS